MHIAFMTAVVRHTCNQGNRDEWAFKFVLFFFLLKVKLREVAGIKIINLYMYVKVPN